MHKIQKHIQIVRSSTKGLSSIGIESANALYKALKQDYAKVCIMDITCQSDLEQLVFSNPDLVFLGMKKLPTPNKTIWLASFLDDHNIAYTGSTQRAHVLELDKSLAKQCVSSAGLKTSPFFVAEQGKEITESDIKFSYPVFIKPTDRGGGAGIDCSSVAHNFTQLKAKVRSISIEHNADSLIEEFLDGREFSVAILRDTDSDEFMIMPLELIAPENSHGDRFLSSAIKSADSETFHIVEDSELKESISNLAMSAFHAIGARDYGRIDVRLDKTGTPHFLEANLIPSILKDYGNFPKACMLNNGMDYEEAVLRITNLAFERTSEVQSADLIPSILLPVATLTP